MTAALHRDPAPAARSPRRENPYRLFATFDADDTVLTDVHDQLGLWLREKSIDVPLDDAGFHNAEAWELLLVPHSESGAHQFRARLVERRPRAVWRTELTVHAPDRGTGWLLLDVSNEHDGFVRVPRLATYLLGVLRLRDGGELELDGSVRVVNSGQVEELAEAVTDPTRTGLVIVAGTDSQLSFDPFVAEVGRWTRQTVGQAETVVLDPLATAEFAEIMMASHAVRPWTLRTYVDDVDPAVESDALRHRFLTTQRLAAAPEDEIEKLLARVARRHAAGRSLPEAVARVGRALARVENGYVVDAVSRPAAGTQPRPAEPAGAEAAASPALPSAAERADEVIAEGSPELTAEPSVADQAARYLQQLEMVRELLGVDELDEETLRELARRSASVPDAAALGRLTLQLQNKQEQIEWLQLELDDSRSALSDEEYEHAVAELGLSEASDEIRWLRRRLKEVKDWQGASAPMPTSELTDYPDSYVDLLAQVGALADAGVVFTGAAKICRELDAYDTLGNTVRTAWDAMLVLADYVRARRAGDWDRGVDEYLHFTPDGYRGMSPTKHAATETAETMHQFGDDRVFPVPEDCEPAGWVTMTAHFKLGRIGMVSPRLYYFDDVTRSGLVFVGYIGPHLRNNQTS